MKHQKPIIRITLSLSLTGLLLVLLTAVLWAATAYSLTRVTTAAGSGRRFSVSPSLSSDGSKIAFQSDADFLGQGISEFQFEIWLYDTTTMTLTRITTAAGSGLRGSSKPSLSSDGSKIAFQSDADFLGQGIPDNQTEIWLAALPPNFNYLPLIFKNETP